MCSHPHNGDRIVLPIFINELEQVGTFLKMPGGMTANSELTGCCKIRCIRGMVISSLIVDHRCLDIDEIRTILSGGVEFLAVIVFFAIRHPGNLLPAGVNDDQRQVRA